MSAAEKGLLWDLRGNYEPVVLRILSALSLLNHIGVKLTPEKTAQPCL